MTVAAPTFRRAMSRFATGVTVVATPHIGGGMCGLTANAFAAVSLDPPEVLVCVARSSSSYPCLRASGVFAASFLGAGQRDLAVRFAERRIDKFDGVPHRVGGNGAPILDGSIGHVECVIEREHPGGDHAILVARVVAAHAGDGDPLVFFASGYATLGPVEPARPGEPLPDAPEEDAPPDARDGAGAHRPPRGPRGLQREA